MTQTKPIVKWITSPVFEFLAAMFRITSHEKLLENDSREVPGRPAGLNQWVEQKRAALPTKLKKELDLFFNAESFFAMTLIRYAWNHQVYSDISLFIESLKELPTNDLFACFLRTGYTDDRSINMNDKQDVVSFIDRSNLPNEEKWKLLYLYMHKERTKQQIIGLFNRFYPYLKDELDSLMEKQEASLGKVKAIADARGEHELLKIMSRTSHLPLNKMNEVVIAPSVFYDDASLTAQTDGKLIFMYGIKSFPLEADYSPDTDKVLQAIKILTDEKRIRMIRLLNQGPLYGYELGQRMNLSNSTISHHLSALASAGLVKPIRKENRIYYEVQRTEIEKLLDQTKKMLVGETI